MFGDKLSKKEWLEYYPKMIKGNKLAVLKVMLDLSENLTNVSNGLGKRLGLKEAKDFLDNHVSGSKEDAELIWKFCKGKLKDERDKLEKKRNSRTY